MPQPRSTRTVPLVLLCALTVSPGCKRLAAGAGAAAGSATRTHRTTDNAFVAAFDRRQQVLAALERSGAVRSCWQSALMRDPAHPTESVRLQLNVDPTGRAQVAVTGVGDPSLGSCIRSRASGPSYGAGDVVATEVVFNLSPGG
jgi:hypothetical protein